MNRKFGRVIWAGLVATAAMTTLMLVSPMMGMPKMAIGEMLASFMNIPVALGWVAHFMIGTILGFVYAFLFAERLPGSSATRGALYGLIPWLLAQMMVNPMMGAGFFAINTPAPLMMVMGSLMGHLVYGVVLGGIYGKGGRVTASVPVSGIA